MRTTSLQKLSEALVKAQSEIKHAMKDSNNSHFKNDYASLESVINASKEALLKQDIIVLQGMNQDGSALVTRLLHKSGEFIETDTKIILSKQDMQGLGSAITYARRYALAAILNISQADDDGNEASKPATASKGKTKPKVSDDF